MQKTFLALEQMAVFGALTLLLSTGAQSQALAQTQSQTILINGFASNLPKIGDGLKRLKTRIPNAKIYSYFGALEGWTYIAPKVLLDVRRAYKRNPNVEINLIGASFGANLLTRIVAVLNKEGIPVSYLGIIDGLPLSPVTPNVRRVDNFTCTKIGCLRDKVKLTRGNDNTIHFAFQLNTTHVDLPNVEDVQQRILHQIYTAPIDVTPDPYAPSTIEQRNLPVFE